MREPVFLPVGILTAVLFGIAIASIPVDAGRRAASIVASERAGASYLERLRDGFVWRHGYPFGR